MQGLFALAHPPVIAGLDPAIHPLRKKNILRSRWTPGSSSGVTRLGCAMPNHVNRNMLLESLPTKDGRGVGERLRIMFWEA
jgi:hypothetical protein